VVSTAGDDENGRKIPASPLPHRISRDDPEIWYVKADTRRCTCDWIAEIDWVADGRRGSTRVDDNGKPFRTGATTAALAAAQLEADGRWIADDAPSLSVKPRTVFWGNAAKLHGRTHAGRAGESLVLLAQPFPFRQPPREVERMVSGPNGKFRFVVRPAVATRFEVARASERESRSPSEQVYVNDRIDIHCRIVCGHRKVPLPLGRHVDRIVVTRHVPPAARLGVPDAPMYVYFGRTIGSTKSPTRLRRLKVLDGPLDASGVQRAVARVPVTVSRASANVLLMCTRGTFAGNGVGPRRATRGCGAASLPFRERRQGQ